jgi:hypothetical protein
VVASGAGLSAVPTKKPDAIHMDCVGRQQCRGTDDAHLLADFSHDVADLVEILFRVNLGH